MSIFKKFRRKKLHKKFEEIQSKMDEISQICGQTILTEISTVNHLLLNPTGDVSNLISAGHSTQVLNQFRRLGYLNFAADISNGDTSGTYRVTAFGMEMLELENNLDLLSH